MICFAKYHDDVTNKEVRDVAVVGWIRGSGLAFNGHLMAVVMKDSKFYEVRADILEFHRWES